MKLRIKGNSIRLRLTKSEITQLETSGFVSEHISFGSSTLHYELRVSAAVANIEAQLNQQVITILLPTHMANQWTQTERVGFEHMIKLPSNENLYVLLEKDFKCLDATQEDQSDMYDNPLRV